MLRIFAAVFVAILGFCLILVSTEDGMLRPERWAFRIIGILGIVIGAGVIFKGVLSTPRLGKDEVSGK